MTFTYDLLGHPLTIAGSDNQTDYVYSADGRKLRATHTQGNNRILFGSNGQRDQYSHYYPYGGLMGDISTNDAHSYKYGGKELDRDFGIDLFDFEARQYDAKVPGFTSIDPLAEKYYGISPYAYCAGDPVNLVDPTGMEIQGHTRNDARLAVKDIKELFASKEFDNFRNLITQSGKRQNGKSLAKISQEALNSAFEGVDLSEDQQALVDIVVNTINSDDAVHVIEYADENGVISDDARNAFQPNPKLNSSIEINGGLLTKFVVTDGGGGVTMSIENGTYSVVVNSNSKKLHPVGRAVNVGHELFGHGRPISLGRKEQQHVDAIQTENLIRRVIGIPSFRNGHDHGDRDIIHNPQQIPSFR